MKFVCHSCSAKYSISDDKIAGGTYSFQCKRCGETLVLRNGAIETRSLAHDPTPEEPALRGQRNENSLLFSVRDTSQISGMVAPSTAAASADSSRQEGSGLLDIQRLAASYQSQDSAPAGNAAIPLQISDDYTPPPFVLPRAPTETAPHRRLLLGLYTTAGSLVVASLVLAMVVMGRGESQLPGQTAESIEPAAQTVAATATIDDTATPMTVDNTATPVTTAPAGDATAENTSTEETAVAATTTAEKPAAKKPVVAARSSRQRTRSSRSTSKATSKTSKTAPDDNDPRISHVDGSKIASCLDEIACELADHPPACCARYKKSSPDRADRSDPTRTANLPDRLDRAAIMKGITSVRPKVRACASSDPAKGQVLVRIKIAGDGKVTSVTVKDTPSDGLGRCVAKAMNSAQFAKSKKGMSFNYPFVF